MSSILQPADKVTCVFFNWVFSSEEGLGKSFRRIINSSNNTECLRPLVTASQPYMTRRGREGF